ncbi:MAG: hypothetical protein KC550_04390 [Nanoarchaeota archaeon]|nr:hypothetical protein [Nanoarchaeota archaeon]
MKQKLNPFKLISKIQSNLLKIIFTFGLILIIFFSAVFSFQYVTSVYESWQKNSEINDIMDGFYSKVENGEISAIDEGLKAFAGFSDEELESLTPQEKKMSAIKEATNLAVFDMKLHTKTNLEGEFECVYLESFNYNDEFSQFIVNEKWAFFYEGFNLFSTDYSYTYFSNVYVSGSRFPLQYFEDEVFTVKYSDSFADINKFVVFSDKVEIVLPDRDKNFLADNINLVYEIVLTDILKDGEKLDNQLFKIPLSISSGKVNVDSNYVCSGTNEELVKKVI